MSTDAKNSVEPVWDALDVARFLKVSRSWVYQQAEAGLLPHRRVGGLLRFDPRAIQAWFRGDGESRSLLPLLKAAQQSE
jgi:excisionase family DNA binding protein